MRLTLNTTLAVLLIGLTECFAGPAMAREVSPGSMTFEEGPEGEVFDAGGKREVSSPTSAGARASSAASASCTATAKPGRCLSIRPSGQAAPPP